MNRDIRCKNGRLITTLLIFFLAACNLQLTEKSGLESVSSGAKDQSSSANSTADQLRTDSILQFDVMITAMLEDSQGNYWFGSHGNGLCRFDGKDYTYFTTHYGLPSGTVQSFAPGPDWSKTMDLNSGDQITSIQEDQQGSIWIKSQAHVSKFDGTAFTPATAVTESVLSTELSVDEWENELNHLWFGATDRLGLYCFDGEQLVLRTFPSPYDTYRDGVSEVYQDSKGNMWFGTMENGTFRYDGKSFIRINKVDEIGICRSVFEDNTGRIWVTNNLISLSYVDGDSLTNFIEEYSQLQNDKPIIEEFKTGFQSIEQDKNGDLWFGTFGNGLWRYDGKLLSHFTNEDELPIVTAKTIYKDREGKLWFGLGEGSAYGYDGQSFYRFDGQLGID